MENSILSADASLKDNPLLQDRTTVHSTPPFAKIQNCHYAPAMRAAIALAQEHVCKIKENPAPPTFANTIEALENADELLNDITGVLFNMDECNTDDELSEIVLQMMPELVRFDNEVWMDEVLFARVKEVCRCCGMDEKTATDDNHVTADGQLTPEEATLLEKVYHNFIRNGVNLSPADKEEYNKCSEELSRLAVLFNKNVLADSNDFSLNITDKQLLSGVPATVMDAAAEEAVARGQQGWTLTLDYPIYGPCMDYADNRDLREKLWRAYNLRGNNDNANNNEALIRRIVELRYTMAHLLGFPDYLSYNLEETMAKSAGHLNDFMTSLLNAAYPAAKRDLQEVQDWMASRGDTTLIQRWDFNYYAEKLKQERYSFDSEQLRPYFQLEKVCRGIFDLYGRLYGLSFVEVHNIEVYHPDVKTYEVKDGDKLMGVLYMDMFPRKSKRSGAWMTAFREQHMVKELDAETHSEKLRDVRPLIQVVCNFTKPAAGRPSLLSFGEVETLMHEMGHAIHGMLSQVTYASLAGTNVYRDFVEMPSQLMENWCREPEFLNTFAHHYETGAAIPAEYIEKIKASDQYLSGWLCVRQLSLGLVDLAFHTMTTPLTEPVDEFERRHMVELLPKVSGCNTSTAFTHIFCGGYAAGYYSYKWSEMLDADIFSKFKQAGIFDHTNAMRFRQEVLSKGGSLHPAVLFHNYMGRAPELRAYLLRDGLIKEDETLSAKA